MRLRQAHLLIGVIVRPVDVPGGAVRTSARRSLEPTRRARGWFAARLGLRHRACGGPAAGPCAEDPREGALSSRRRPRQGLVLRGRRPPPPPGKRQCSDQIF